MSSDFTSTLLPPARVDFYVADDATAATAEKLSADWRFARVEIRIVSGGLDDAIAAYGQSASPELLILETSDIGESFIGRLGDLAGVCAEGTDAVIIGPTNDVHLYRNLIGMGVRDYLVRPVSENDMVGVIAQSLVDKRGLTGARLVAIVGGKGGVGTTTLAQLLAWSCAEGLEQKTLLIDAAGSNSTLGVAYGVEPSTSFSEAVKTGVGGSEDDMKRIVQKATENLSILVCGGDPVLGVRPSPDDVEKLINRIMHKSPIVVMDLSGASRAVQQRMIAIASEVVVVTTPLLSSLRNTRTYLGEIKAVRQGLKEVSLVVNMHGMAAGQEVPMKDIESALGMAPTVRIPYAPKIFAASEASGRPAGGDLAAAEIMHDLMPISARAAGVAPKEGVARKDGKAGVMSLFKSKLGKAK